MYEENDVVRLRRSHPDEGLRVGQRGAVVCAFVTPDEAYEVEFVGGDGVTWAQLTLRPDELEPWEPTSEVPEIVADETFAGDPSDFAIGYAFLGDDRCTELSMWVHGTNLLGFTREGCHYTTRWLYLEDLVAWLSSFALSMSYDPFPIDVDGEYAAEKDANARDLAPDLDDDSSDEEMEAFDAYFDHFSDWTWDHTWHSESGGAILSDMFFEYKDGMVELSWDNRYPEEGVVFDCEFGGTRVDAETFKSVVLEFVDAYERRWGIKVDDDSTWLRRSRA